MQIDFFPKSTEAEILVPKPKPARHYVPNWFKNLPAFENDKFEPNPLGGNNGTAKLCVPLTDTFHMGYIQETWCDLYIKIDKDGSLLYRQPSIPNMVSHRPSTGINYGQFYYSQEALWQLQWIPQLPEGFSILYTHPLNRFDLPFETISGIVDSDKFKFEADANHPFIIKKGFEGIIPKGTPMVQMIPFKRDEWQSVYLKHNKKDQLKAYLPHQFFWGGYKKLFWTKKIFR